MYQRLLDAFKDERGVRLTAEEVEVLVGENLATFEYSAQEPEED